MTQIRFEGLRSPALSALSRSPAALELSTRSVARWDHAGVADDHPKVARIIAAAARYGIAIDVLRFPAGTRSAADAANAVGAQVAQIVKSLVFMADGAPVIALVSGSDRLDPARLAATLGVARVDRATGDEARAATGYAIGGIPPFAHDQELRVVMDARLLRHDTVWAAAGLPDAVFAIAPAQLGIAARAHIADIAEISDGSPGITVTVDPPAG
jgi:prolyl-tRNA editing enzyme YbaK/EbsC (Cys-tRNA(Pro) deacylase)